MDLQICETRRWFPLAGTGLTELYKEKVQQIVMLQSVMLLVKDWYMGKLALQLLLVRTFLDWNAFSRKYRFNCVKAINGQQICNSFRIYIIKLFLRLWDEIPTLNRLIFFHRFTSQKPESIIYNIIINYCSLLNGSSLSRRYDRRSIPVGWRYVETHSNVESTIWDFTEQTCRLWCDDEL